MSADTDDIPQAFPSPGDVVGRRVVITGTSRGLGEVLAHAFSRAGAAVALVARTERELKTLAASLPGRSLACAGDVRDADFNEAVADSVVAEWGGIDAWICNAGISPIVAGPRGTSPEVWRDVLDVNLTGAFLGARAAARVMAPAPTEAAPVGIGGDTIDATPARTTADTADRAHGGRIIFTGSVLGERPSRGLSAYSASKAGLVALAKSLALDLARDRITVNVVAPGWFDSPLTEGWTKDPQWSDRVLSHTALNRWGAAADLPGAYLYLASDAASFVTGTVLTVDAGYLLV